MTCPKCHAPVNQSGDLDVDGAKLAVYQCDECTVPWEIDGQTFPTALTFAVDQHGTYLDAETLQPFNLN